MWKEVAVLGMFYLIGLGTHVVAHKAGVWMEHRRRARAEHDALAPLDSLGPKPAYKHPGAHVVACCVAMVASPATLETVKHYVVHLFVYSGYIIPLH